MKTLEDLFALILSQTKMNDNKMVKFAFEVSTEYMWVSMTKILDRSDAKEKNPIFQNMSIETPEELQLVYWTIYNKSRK